MAILDIYALVPLATEHYHFIIILLSLSLLTKLNTI